MTTPSSERLSFPPLVLLRHSLRCQKRHSLKWKVKDKFVPLVCLLSPFVAYYIAENSEVWLNYKFGFELLILNGAITFMGLYLLRK